MVEFPVRHRNLDTKVECISGMNVVGDVVTVDKPLVTWVVRVTFKLVRRAVGIVDSAGVVSDTQLGTQLFFAPAYYDIILAASITPSVAPGCMPEGSFSVTAATAVVPRVSDRTKTFNDVRDTSGVMAPSSLTTSVCRNKVRDERLGAGGDALVRVVEWTAFVVFLRLSVTYSPCFSHLSVTGMRVVNM